MPQWKEYATTSKGDLLIRDWVEFWSSKWSVFLKDDKNTKISPDYLLSKRKFSKNEKRNLFFTINGYRKKEGSVFPKNRSSANVNRLNCFFFDIDLKENSNKGITKSWALRRLREFEDRFHIIVETRSGFHCYVLLDPRDYPIGMKDAYLSDWKKLWAELSAAVGLEFDPAVYDLARISRIPGTYHRKKSDTDTFELVIHKGLELVRSSFKREKKISLVPIRLVLDALGIKHAWKFLFDWGIRTSGRKIRDEENSVSDHSHKGRPVWKPFNFVALRYRRFEGLANREAKSKTFYFFQKHFGIISENVFRKTVEVPIDVEAFLANDPKIDWNAIHAVLSMFWRAAKKSESSGLVWKKFSTPAYEVFSHHKKRLNITNRIDALKQCAEYLTSARLKTWKQTTPLMDLKIRKRNGERFLDFSLLPRWAKHYGLNFSHYVNGKIFELSTKGASVKAYTFLCNRLINVKDTDELVLSKKRLMLLLEDMNITRSMAVMKGIQDITADFRMEKTRKEVIFRKGKEKN